MRTFADMKTGIRGVLCDGLKPALWLGFALLSTQAMAQDVLIRQATVHTAGARGTLKNTDVLVQGGTIRAIGPNLVAPAGVATFEARGKPLTPGLFGGITEIGLEEISLEESTVDANLQGNAEDKGLPTQLYPEFDVTLAYNPRSVLLPIARVGGITFTALGTGGAVIAGQGGVVRLDGGFDGPLGDRRIMFAGIGNGLLGQSGKSRAAQYLLLEQAIAESRLLPTVDEKLLSLRGRAALSAAIANGRLFFSVNREADIRQLLKLSRRLNFRFAIVGGAEAWRVAPELAAAKVPVFVNALSALPADFDQIGTTLENAARLQRAGVAVAIINNDDGSHNARKVRQIAGNAVANGLPWEAGLAGLTSVPAEALGVADKVGRIEVGLVADLVLWTGDPLDVSSVTSKLWMAGRDLPLRSRQTDLRDRYLQAPGELPRAYQH